MLWAQSNLAVCPELGRGSGVESLSCGCRAGLLQLEELPRWEEPSPSALSQGRAISICTFPHGLAGGSKDLISWDSLHCEVVYA